MDNEFNAFDGGVAEGGLRNTVQIKILLEHLLHALGGADRDTLVQAVSLHSLANYFETLQATDELEQSGNIITVEGGKYLLTEKGKANLLELVNDLPFSVRETALKDAQLILKRKRIQESTRASVNKTENGYEAVCTVRHGDENLMTLSLYAPDLPTALDFAQKFDDDPEKIYSQVLSAFYGKEENGNA